MASQSVTSLAMASQVKAPLAINCTILFLVLIVVGLRIWTRILGILCLGIQGFFSTIGMGYDAVPSSPHYEEREYTSEASLPETNNADNVCVQCNVVITNSNLLLKILFGFDMLYVHALALLKTSVLSFYLRVFGAAPGGPRRTVQALLALVGAWVLALSLALAFVCHPLPFRWDPTLPGGACGSQTALYATLIVTNVVMDLVIMLLTMYVVWSLKMRGPEKIGLMACFVLSMAVIVASCVRLATVFNSSNDNNSRENPTGGALSTNVFLCVFELLLGILCISLPTLGPLYLRLTSRFLSSTSSRLRGGNGNGGNGHRSRHLYGYGHSSSASGSSSTAPPSPPSGLNQHPPSTRSAMSMRDGSSRHRRHMLHGGHGTARSSQHYSQRAAAATTRMGYNQNTVSSYATTAVNSTSVPAAWQLNDPLTFPPLTLQTPPLLQPPPSAYASAQGRSRYHHHDSKGPNKDLNKDINDTSRLFSGGGGGLLYHDHGSISSSSSSEDHDSRRSDEPFSDKYYAARERARLLQQGTDVENMAHLFPLPPSRKGPLANMTPPSTSHGHEMKKGPIETSWLSMHD
ncbi:hypothetical protein PG994_013572 [Apiospora phragmitis]|uniref:Rhodopsin domain-containing protein n=1 Tax=Apiospora phragmitis TaxID=2905665 RepID=A0ABR1T937_9PEZI